MSSLLPKNATDFERALESATTVNLTTAAADYYNIDTCPTELLPYLAYQFALIRWGTQTTQAEQRNQLNAAMQLQLTKGTRQALHTLMQQLGYSIDDYSLVDERALFNGVHKFNGAIKWQSVPHHSLLVRFTKPITTEAGRKIASTIKLINRASVHLLPIEHRAKFNGEIKFDGTHTWGEVTHG